MIKDNFIKLYESSFKKNAHLLAFSDYTDQTQYTYAAFAEEIAKLHLIFDQFQIQKGDKIALVGRNNIQWATVYMATITYGAVIVPILQDFRPADINHIVNHSDAVLFFAADSIWNELDEQAMPLLKGVLSLQDFHALNFNNQAQTQELVVKAAQQFEAQYPEGFDVQQIKYADTSNADPVLINYTSGTTGFSKGVILTGNNLAGNTVFGIEQQLHFQGSRCLSFLPLAHAYGCAFDYLVPLAVGTHITLLGKIPSPKIIVEAFSKVKPHLVCSVPLVLEKIYKNLIVPKINKPSIKFALKIPGIKQLIHKKIRKTLINSFGGVFEQIIIGGAPLNPEVEHFLHLIRFPFTVGYGMTECAPLISYTHHSKFIPTSSGRILEGIMEVKILSNNPETIPGEILVRGENVMAGYYKNPEATAEVLDAEGWLHTGDVGTLHDDQTIFIRGRSKTMLLGASGQNIYPEEIEAKLNVMPYVMESLIIEHNGKLVALVYPDPIALRADQIDSTTLQTLMDKTRKAVNKQVAVYENISAIKIVDQEFEKTPKKSIKRFLYHDFLKKA